MVRLLLQISECQQNRPKSFQSHNGAIAAAIHRVPVQTVAKRFNPTMVRLLPLTLAACRSERHRFQSHNGAIAAAAKPPMTGTALMFQSHNGAIAALLVMSVFLI